MPLFFNIASLVSVLLLSWLFWVGVEESYFWIYFWYDIPLHMLGGLTIGLWAMAVAARNTLSVRRALVLAVVLVLPVLVAWEIWEYWVGLTRGMAGYWLDTPADILNGMLGAAIALALYLKLKRI